MESMPNASHYEKDMLTLDYIFKKIINTNSQIEVTLNVLNHIIETDLNLKPVGLDDDQKSALPYMLMRYIKNWPGWSKKEKYDDGSIELESWMLRFRNYIYYKMQLLVSRTLPNLKPESNAVRVKSIGTQSEFPVNFSKFSIDISGPAKLLNNLVFSGHEGNIRAEEHAERPWIPLEFTDLLNYPYVEVEFNSPELSFKRTFEPKISQYLSSTSDFKVEKSNFILGKHSIDYKYSKWPIKISVLDIYIKAFKSEMSSHMSIPQQEELCLVLDQFYQDMVDISDENAVCENRQVIFNVGRNVYKRTKKISNGCSSPDVVFNERLLPRVTISFRYFTGMQNDSAKKIAANPDKINTKIMMAFIPIITYKCIFCKVTFPNPNAQVELVKHLEKIHGRSQTLVCLLCRKCIEVAVLSRQRWKCTCSEGS